MPEDASFDVDAVALFSLAVALNLGSCDSPCRGGIGGGGLVGGAFDVVPSWFITGGGGIGGAAEWLTTELVGVEEVGTLLAVDKWPPKIDNAGSRSVGKKEPQ